jgi:heme-degrading monooxygenase HmoA
MIARVRSAQTTTSQAPAYAAHLRSEVLPALHRIDGYCGAMLLERNVGGMVEVMVITHWQSLASVRAFAGTDLEKAVVADEAAALFTQFDRRVRHYDVVVEDHEPARTARKVAEP